MLLAVIVGGIILSILPIIFVACLALSAMLSFSGEEIEEHTVLAYNIETPLIERQASSSQNAIITEMMGGQTTIGLDVLLRTIDYAKDDSRIEGILLQGSSIDASMATIREIRQALNDFKTSGKFVYYFNESADQSAIFLASVADSLFVSPSDGIEMFGLTARSTFYKNLLDKIGVDVEIIRHGRYKSAVEPFAQDHMSDDSRYQMQELVNSLWKTVSADIAQSRNISTTKIDNYINSLDFVTPESAIKAGLVDATIYRDEFLTKVKNRLGIAEKKDINSISVIDYATNESLDDFDGYGDKIAIIYADGEIFDGSSKERTDIFADDLSRAIRQARRDKDIRGVVLRVNSPGGSASAAEVIWREVKLCSESKPTVVSMGDYAASGGYYIACAANKIVADPATITGSIGVFGIIPCAEKTLGKLGITTDVVSSHSAPRPAISKPLSDKQVEYYRNSVEQIYDVFLTRVADGRQMTKSKVDNIAQGRVWSGIEAQKINLIDTLGTINDAVNIVAQMADLNDYDIVELPEYDQSLLDMMSSTIGQIRMSVLQALLGKEVSLHMMESFTEPRVLTLMDGIIDVDL